MTLPGTHKLKTICNLIVGEHALRVEAFVMRQPDERREELWAWLLQRNARMYGVAFSIDAVGDVYLTGRVSAAARRRRRVGPAARRGADLRRRVASTRCWRSASATSIRREWEWRVKRGEPLDNLKAFTAFVERDS